jgi:hypothetical protein
MKPTQDISQVLRQLRVPASSELDERVYAEIAKATLSTPSPPSSPALALGQTFTLFLKRKSTLYTLATTLVLALLVILVLNHSTSSAWAMDQAIEALKKYRAVHITGYYTSSDFRTGGESSPLGVEVWARSDATGNLVENGLAKVGNVTTWTSGNNTYTYDQTQKKVFVEPGINFVFNNWFGPKLLADLATMKDYKAFEGDDPATGQKRVIVTCSLENLKGPNSFLMEFDVRTKLLVSMKSWRNLQREGDPQFDFEKIIYFDDLPDSAFSFQPPTGIPFTDLSLGVPESQLSLLSDPARGISADGMTREQACQKILGQLWDAVVRKDLGRIRQLFPLTAAWSDEMLHPSDNPSEKAVQVLKIGGIERVGNSKLGPLKLVPCWIRYQDGTVREIWMVVQFRDTPQGTSCVVQGPRGYALNVKE